MTYGDSGPVWYGGSGGLSKNTIPTTCVVRLALYAQPRRCCSDREHLGPGPLNARTLRSWFLGSCGQWFWRTVAVVPPPTLPVMIMRGEILFLVPVENIARAHERRQYILYRSVYTIILYRMVKSRYIFMVCLPSISSWQRFTSVPDIVFFTWVYVRYRHIFVYVKKIRPEIPCYSTTLAKTVISFVFSKKFSITTTETINILTAFYQRKLYYDRWCLNLNRDLYKNLYYILLQVENVDNSKLTKTALSLKSIYYCCSGMASWKNVVESLCIRKWKLKFDTKLIIEYVGIPIKTSDPFRFYRSNSNYFFLYLYYNIYQLNLVITKRK